MADLIYSIYSWAAGCPFNFPDGFHGSDSFALDNNLPKVETGTACAAQPCRSVYLPRALESLGMRWPSQFLPVCKVLIVGADTMKQKHFDFLLIQIFFFCVYGASCPFFFLTWTRSWRLLFPFGKWCKKTSLQFFLFFSQYYLFIFATLRNFITGKWQDHRVHTAPFDTMWKLHRAVYRLVLSKPLTLNICGQAPVYLKMRFRKVSDWSRGTDEATAVCQAGDGCRQVASLGRTGWGASLTVAS